jgi:Flp pilus assembly protein TadB
MRYRWDPMYPSSGRRSSSYADAHVRASDAERNDVAERLSRHFTDGRLDQSEFKARLDRTMGASTRGDLEGLFDDLPHLPTEEPPRTRHRRIVPVLLVVLLVALGATMTFPLVRVPWLLVVVIGVFVWHRASRHGSRL